MCSALFHILGTQQWARQIWYWFSWGLPSTGRETISESTGNQTRRFQLRSAVKEVKRSLPMGGCGQRNGTCVFLCWTPFRFTVTKPAETTVGKLSPDCSKHLPFINLKSVSLEFHSSPLLLRSGASLNRSNFSFTRQPSLVQCTELEAPGCLSATLNTPGMLSSSPSLQERNISCEVTAPSKIITSSLIMFLHAQACSHFSL